MKNRRIVLWRHGRTSWNSINSFQGQEDVPLDEVGLDQVRRAAQTLVGLKPAKIVSSDLVRARQTAEALSEISKLQVLIDAGLRETNGGKWEGRTGAENRAVDFERFVTWLDGNDEPAGEIGERRSEIAARAVAAIERAIEPNLETLVVVTHGGTARIIIGKMLGLPMNQWATIGGLSNAAWSILESGHHRPGWILVEHNAGSLPEPIFGEESGA